MTKHSIPWPECWDQAQTKARVEYRGFTEMHFWNYWEIGFTSLDWTFDRIKAESWLTDSMRLCQCLAVLTYFFGQSTLLFCERSTSNFPFSFKFPVFPSLINYIQWPRFLFHCENINNRTSHHSVNQPSNFHGDVFSFPWLQWQSAHALKPRALPLSLPLFQPFIIINALLTMLFPVICVD